MQERTAEWGIAGDSPVKTERPPVAYTFFKVLVIFFIGLLISFAISWPIIMNFSRIQEMALRFKPKAEYKATAARIGVENLPVYKAGLEKDLTNVNKKLAAFQPKGPYLIINTSGNDFTMMNGDKVVRKGQCSTGSYTVLQAGEKKQWIFKTPRGMFKIQNKKEQPVWKKPDWAFIEEGLPVPSPNHPSRYEYGVLGDYAMTLGQGYMIHGTLYKRFLGMPVTHGCIRMGDDDLEEVFSTMSIGSKVYIY